MESRTQSPPPRAFSSKFESVVAPGRRRPPTALRLITGPLPPRSKPRHTLPSLPRPTFHTKAAQAKGSGPLPRPRVNELIPLGVVSNTPSKTPPVREVCHDLPLSFGIDGTGPSDDESEPSSPSSDVSSSEEVSPQPSRRIRAPWNHSSAIRVPFDVSAVIQPPRAAATSHPGFRC